MAMHRKSFLLVGVLLAAGCWSKPALPPYNSQRAEEILVLALDAWKQGRVGALARRDPPVRFEDDDYRNGLRLTDYRLPQRRRPIQPFDDVQVTLLLRNRWGNKVEKAVVYQIMLTPDPAVLRND